MEQFDLEKWLENPSRKVVTRNGKPVRIVCWDKLGKYPIIACIEYSEKYEDFETYTIKGLKYSFDCDKNDLFFADEEKDIIRVFKSETDEEPETIEIPFGVKDSEFISGTYTIPEGCKARIEGNKVIIEKIQKEENLTEFEKAIYQYICIIVNACDGNIYGDKELKPIVKVIAKELFDLARKELQPEFEAELDKAYKCADKVQYENGKKDALKSLPKWRRDCFHNITSVVDGRLYYNGYYIDINELEKLPKVE